MAMKHYLPEQIPFTGCGGLTCHQQWDRPCLIEKPQRTGKAYGWAPDYNMQPQMHSEATAFFPDSSDLSFYFPLLSLSTNGESLEAPPSKMLTGIKTAEDPGMVGLGRVPGMEAGMGCLCLLWRWSRDDREPGTGLGTKRKKQKTKTTHYS